MTDVSAHGRLFDIPLAPVTLEAGARIDAHVLRGWWWGPPEDLPALARATVLLPESEAAAATGRIVRRTRAELAALAARAPDGGPGLSDDVPTVLVIHALTGDARAGGPNGWWGPVVGPDGPIDPRRYRVLGFNNLGSCYGTSGPADEGFPTRADDNRFALPAPAGKGAFALPEERLPATITTWDQARSILMALDRLGVKRVHLTAGGSVGGMIVLALLALAPERFERALVIGAAVRATPWLIGWDHVMRGLVLMDPGYPDDIGRGIELARQVAHLTYRAEPGLIERHGRRPAEDERDTGGHEPWSSRRGYRVQTYLEHQGQKFRGRFDARAYLTQLDACDHHDLDRVPAWLTETGRSEVRPGFGEERIRAAVLGVGIDTDNLYPCSHMMALVADLQRRGRIARARVLTSPHGHDAFLIEWDPVRAFAAEALLLPAGRRGDDD